MSTTRLEVDQFLHLCAQHELRIFPWSTFVKGPCDNGNESYGSIEDDNCDEESEIEAKPGELRSNLRTVGTYHITEETITKNPISELNEYSQITLRNKYVPEFQFIPIGKLFKCTASISNGTDDYITSATSTTKKDAKTLAAKQLMNNIKKRITSNTNSQESKKENAVTSSYNQLCQNNVIEKNYVSLLHEYCAQMRISKPEANFEKRGDNFCCTIKIDNYYGYGCSIRKKDSKDFASEDLLKKLKAKSR